VDDAVADGCDILDIVVLVVDVRCSGKEAEATKEQEEGVQIFFFLVNRINGEIPVVADGNRPMRRTERMLR